MFIRPTIAGNRLSRSRYRYKVIDSHTAGAPTRFLLRGVPELKGFDMGRKKKYFMKKFDHVRTTLIQEPRGNSGILAIPAAPSTRRADLGLIFADYRGYVDMCIHGTIGVVTTLVECGLVSQQKIRTRELVFDTPAGVVKAQFAMKGRKVSWVRLTNVPSFFLRDETASTNSFGDVRVSIAFGGNIYGYVDSKELGLKIKPENLNELLKAGREILRGTKKLNIKHPISSGIRGVLGVSLFQDIGKLKTRNIMIAENDLFDRSPCGTGTCGRMAVMHAKGEIRMGEEFESRSIINSAFFGRILEVGKEEIGGNPHIVPEIRGTAYITGASDITVSEADPLSYGFLVG